MNKNIIFYFSGTGNSLKAAKDIANKIPNCEVVSMANEKNLNIDDYYDRIGFVFPTYFVGIPLIVNRFIKKLNLEKNKTSYYFAVSTCGEIFGNSIVMINDLLMEKNIKLNYGKELKMFSNYVVLYDMASNIEEKTIKSNENIIPIINDIIEKKENKNEKSNFILNLYYNFVSKKIKNMDKNYNISSDCILCGICAEVCPVNNIEIKERPIFKNNCEQCMSCIQYCPKSAINYKNRTQNRKRYKNPSISYKELIEKNTN